MKEFIEKLIGRLEEKFKYNSEQAEIWRSGSDKDAYSRGQKDLYMDRANTYGEVMRIVNQLAEEYKNGWISSDVDLPKENGWYWGYYVTSSYKGTDGVKHTECKYASIYWEDNLWLYDPRSFRTVDEVIAWKPIAPYQPKGE